MASGGLSLVADARGLGRLSEAALRFSSSQPGRSATFEACSNPFTRNGCRAVLLPRVRSRVARLSPDLIGLAPPGTKSLRRLERTLLFYPTSK